MASRKTLAHRLFNAYKTKTTTFPVSSCRIISSSASIPDRLAPDPGDSVIFRRFLHRNPTTSSELRSSLTGDNLIEKLREIDFSRSRIRLDGLVPPPAPSGETAEVEVEVEGRLTVEDARKVLRLSQLETVKGKLREMPMDCVSYSEFLRICCENSSEQLGRDFAKILDDSGTVIILGNVVFLRPDEVVKTLQSLLPMPRANNPNEPQMMMELKKMEEEKAEIDKKAESLVRRELWTGLGYFVIQTAAFMRLTFWELSWDVMEPICFYVTSVYCMAGYAFFLRTSKEPSFEGFFQSRFAIKQNRLMKNRMFDLQRYNELRRACYPHSSSPPPGNTLSFNSSSQDVNK